MISSSRKMKLSMSSLYTHLMILKIYVIMKLSIFLNTDTESILQRCSVKKVFLEILQNSQQNTCARVSFLITLQAEVCNFIKKETLAQVFSCEFCKISKTTFSHRTPPMAASADNINFFDSQLMQQVLIVEKLYKVCKN